MPHGGAEGLTGGRLPQPRGRVPASGEDGLAVGAEGHGTDLFICCKGAPRGLPVDASQSRAVLSSLRSGRSCRRG